MSALILGIFSILMIGLLTIRVNNLEDKVRKMQEEKQA